MGALVIMFSPGPSSWLRNCHVRSKPDLSVASPDLPMSERDIHGMAHMWLGQAELLGDPVTSVEELDQIQIIPVLAMASHILSSSTGSPCRSVQC